MTAAEWIPVGARKSSRQLSLKAGETLFRTGMNSAGLYEVMRGRLRLVRVDRAGREIVLYVAGPGETLAEASLFSASYHCDAIAASDAIVRLYPKAAVLTGFERDPNAMRKFAGMLARQVMTLRTRLERNAIRSAEDRARHYLSLNVGADGRTVNFVGTLKDLAADLGLTHEALYRALARLAKSGEIKRGKGFASLTARFRV
jgi:CRP-like cAMP-binding protein